MKRWRRTVRIGMLAVAGVVLLAVAVPQVASGIGLTSLANRLASLTSCSSGSSDSSGSSCCSGSSGSASESGSSGCATGPGTVTGSVTVTGAPVGSAPTYVGAGACPYLGPSSLAALCPDPSYALQYNGSYTFSLDPGTWVVSGFYEVNPFGGAFLGTPQVVTVTSGGTLTLDLTVPYVKPATLAALVKVTGLPTGTTVQSVSVLLCPAGSPYTGDPAPITCVSSNNYFPTPGPSSGTITLTGLPSGSWTAYPGYCTTFGCGTNPKAGKSVTLTAGHSSKVRLTTGYLVPPQGLVNATVTVTGAPAGFSAPVGVTACQVQSFFTTCTGWGGQADGSSFPLQLASGVWEITAAYYAPVFGNPINGPTELVDVQGGQILNLTMAVPYQVLGTAAGSIKVAGLPGGTKVTSYTVTACPDSVITAFPFLSCVSEYSGPGVITYGAANTRRMGRNVKRLSVPRAATARINTYNLPTLTPGAWDLSVQYTTAFGTFYGQGSTKVNVAGGQTTTTKLTVPYQAPTLGDVTGKVSVVGAPAYGFQAGARACSTAPVAGSCTGEVDAYLGANSKYQLNLPPGTWWVEGVVYDYLISGVQTITTAPRQVTVGVGSKSTQNFTVTVG